MAEELSVVVAKLVASEAARAESEAARAASEVARAASEAARAAAELRALELSAKLERALHLAGVDGGAALRTAPSFAPAVRLVRASLKVPSERLHSPTADGARCFLESKYTALIDAPATLPAADAALASDFRRLIDTGSGARGMMSEANMYALATSVLPRFAKAVGASGGDMSAASLFTDASHRTAVWIFSDACKPELHVCAAAGGGGDEPSFRPAYNGELKTAGDGRALEQAAYYAAMDMVRIFFPARDSGATPCPRRFFARAPLGFALVAFPHVGYFVALEWVGKLLVSPASTPFLVGSAAHKAAAAALPDERYEEPRELEAALEWLTPADAPGRDRVAWSISGGVFRKLVRGDARSGAAFASMFRAYARLGEVLLAEAPPAHLHLVAYARLSFGAHELLVEMPAVAGREATESEMDGGGGGGLLVKVAATVAWLARRRLVHVDLRAPNVMVDVDGHPWLVDFDDMLVTPEPVISLEGFRAALLCSAAAKEHGTFASSFLGGGQSAFATALAQAFATAEP